MKRAAHGAPKAKGRSYSPLSLFVAQHGEHGAHGSHSEHTSSHDSSYTSSNSPRTSRGAHGLHGARSYQTNRNSERLTALAASNGAVVEVSDAVAERLQEIMPQSRREIRLSRLANERRRRLLISTSMLAMIGAVAATMSLTKINTFDSRAAELEHGITSVDDSSALNVSRSSQRTSLDSPDSMDAINNAVDAIENASGSDSGDASHAAHAAHAAHADYSANANNSGAYASSGISGVLGISTARNAANSHPGTASVTSSKSDSWNLGADSGFNIAEMSRSAADNPQVALLMDKDFDVLPKGFNPNHATGDTGNAYEFSQCTWWVYVRRHQLGLPVGSHFGNGNMWADSARGLGYWVDRTPRHVGDVMVFRAGQAGSDPFYGHVAIVEKINPDGSIETSESGASLHGKTFSRKFDAKQLSQYQFIHY